MEVRQQKCIMHVTRACAAGKDRLMEVLRRIMIRSSKAGVTESLLLPKCTKTTVRLKFDPGHQASYNALVEVPPPPQATCECWVLLATSALSCNSLILSLHTHHGHCTSLHSVASTVGDPSTLPC